MHRSPTLNFNIYDDNEIISVVVYDIYGQEIETLIDNESYNMGNYNIEFKNKNLFPGIYYVVFKTKNYIKTTPITVIK